MKRFLLIAACLLSWCWGLKGQDIDQPADSAVVQVAGPQMEVVGEEDVVLTPDGVYWLQGDLKKKGKTIKFQGSKLPAAERDGILMTVGGQPMVDDWHKYTVMRGWGTGVTIGGGVLFVTGAAVGVIYLLAGTVGTIFAAIGGQEAVNKLWAEINAKAVVGNVLMLTGLATTASGIVLLSVSNHNMRGMVKTCNEAGQPFDATFAFGPTHSGGIGLTYNF